MPIFKTTITITVLSEFDKLREAQNCFAAVETDYVVRQITEGDWLGQTHVGDIVLVPDDQVPAECEALGSDGEFFGLQA